MENVAEVEVWDPQCFPSLGQWLRSQELLWCQAVG